jgi:hypothetical protein
LLLLDELLDDIEEESEEIESDAHVEGEEEVVHL